MDPKLWFETFVKEYRKIVREKYSQKKEFFPFCQPMEVHVYLVDDEKRIFPEVLVFFLLIDEDTQGFLSDSVVVFEEKIAWPKDFDSLEGYDREIAIITVDQELFQENRWPISSISKSLDNTILERDPIDRAQMMVQEHLIKGFEKELIDIHMERCRLRMMEFGADEVQEFLSRLKNLQNIQDDEERADVLSEAFWLLGFETLNLEEMKDADDYQELHKMAHMDVLGFLLPSGVMVAVEEGRIDKKRWYKLFTLNSTLELLKIRREDWEVVNIMIGKRSRGIAYLEGNVRCISYDDFFKAISGFVKSQYRGAISPVLKVLWLILGHKVKLFKIP